MANFPAATSKWTASAPGSFPPPRTSIHVGSAGVTQVTIEHTKTNIAICKALGLDPNTVAGLTISLEPGARPVVKATFLVPEDDYLVEELEKFELIPVDERRDEAINGLADLIRIDAEIGGS